MLLEYYTRESWTPFNKIITHRAVKRFLNIKERPTLITDELVKANVMRL